MPRRGFCRNSPACRQGIKRYTFDDTGMRDGHTEPHAGRSRSLLRVAIGIAGLPVGLITLACVPGLNSMVFSGHGGPGWLALPFCFPLLVINTYRHVVKPRRQAGVSPWTAGLGICLSYLILAYPLATVAEHRITAYSGLPIADHVFYRLMTLPLGFVVPPWH